jgi:hypothetical protein
MLSGAGPDITAFASSTMSGPWPTGYMSVESAAVPVPPPLTAVDASTQEEVVPELIAG